MITSGLGRRHALSWVALAAVFTLPLAGCVDGIIGVRGSGNMTTENRDVVGFSEIVLESSGEVNIEMGDAESLTIEAEDNLMSHLTSDVENGQLVLGTSGSIVTTRNIVYTITATELSGITVAGSGDVEVADVTTTDFSTVISGSGTVDVTGLSADSLEVAISGSGQIDMTGTADRIDVEIPGSGSFDGEEMESATADVSISGSGDAVVNVSETLNANVSGSGSIEYLGSPEVSSNISGSGSITPR
ncbi:MAG TPA: head GIN domain-containing protein [Acidimicrobiia bacterium]